MNLGVMKVDMDEDGRGVDSGGDMGEGQKQSGEMGGRKSVESVDISGGPLSYRYQVGENGTY